MGDIIIWHGQDRNLCYRAWFAFYNTCPFIQGCQFTVQITGIALSGRDFSLGGGYLTHGLTEGGNICQDDQNVHAFFKGKIFGSSQSDFRCKKTLYYRVIGQVQKHNYVIGGSAFLEGAAEKFCYIIFNAHGCENNGKFLIGILSQRGLLYDLCSQLIVGQTIAGKDG